jgi:hypothetical protein
MEEGHADFLPVVHGDLTGVRIPIRSIFCGIPHPDDQLQDQCPHR